MGFQTTTKLAKTYGRTVNQMKLILAEEGLLGETGPTQDAFDRGIARLVELNPETASFPTNGRTHYPTWDFDTVKGILKRRGEAPGDRKRVQSVHQVFSALSAVGGLMQGMPGMDRSLSDVLMYNFHCGNFGLRLLSGQDGILDEFRAMMADTRDVAAKKRGRWKAPAGEILAWLNAVEDFLKRKRWT